ncbi:MAG TPA: SapC family protein [Burkholderiales bacterium]|nr:SapC family protein [Burkholderiales bacterium]
MQISPPFGYKEVVPFLKTQKVRLLAPGEVPEFVQRGNAVPISHTEFQPIGRHYPIVFTTGDEGKSYAAVAVLGMSAGENLFYADGRWTSGSYIPAYARRYPFCMARVNLNQVEQKDRLICVEKSWLDEERGDAMFDSGGQPSEKWKGVERLLAEYEADLERMREMCVLLADYGLLEPFSMQATLKKEKGGGSMQMTGMHRVAEKNLENLNTAQLKNLIRKGYLARIYIHLLSLENFARLLDRKGERAAAPA